MPLSLTATQLIVSKICHDLAGPIGAIGAGVEAMTEQPGDAGALSLIEETQRSLVARLDMFRIAFGRGGAAILGDLKRTRTLVDSHLRASGGRARVSWPDDVGALSFLSADGSRLLVLLILVLVDSLPRGGGIDVKPYPTDVGHGLALSANGDRALIREDISDAWRHPLANEDGLTARNIHAHVARVLAADMNTEVALRMADDDSVSMAAGFARRRSDSSPGRA